jgi:hypothetical protein
MFLEDRGEIRGDIVISFVRDDRFDIVTEGLIVEGLFEFGDHVDEVRMGFAFKLIVLHEFDRVEERAIDVLAFEGNEDITDEVLQIRIGDDGFGFPLLIRGFVSNSHEFVDVVGLQSGDADDWNAKLIAKGLKVDLIALFREFVHHVDGHDHRNIDFE